METFVLDGREGRVDPTQRSSFIVVSSSRLFDFSFRFEDSIFGLLPAALLLVVGSARLFQLWRQRQRLVYDSAHRQQTRFTLLLLAALSLVLLVLASAQAPHDDSSRLLRILAAASSVASSGMLVCLSTWEYTKSARPSFVVSLSLLLTIAFDTVRTRTYWFGTVSTAFSAIFTASLALKVVILCLELRSKRQFLRPLAQHYSLEQTAGPIGLFFWTWLVIFLYTGFRRRLSSLTQLIEIDENLLAPSLRRSWVKSDQQIYSK